MAHDAQRSLQHIRQHMRSLGFAVDELSDAEISAGIRAFGERVAGFGLTASEATEGIRRIGSVGVLSTQE